MSDNAAAPANKPSAQDMLLFWGCFIALIATAFGFIVRTQVIDDWGSYWSLSKTQKGEIFGVGLWPFAISIVLFSLIIDRIGYGKAMVFAFICHVVSAIITIYAVTIPAAESSRAYWTLYIGTFIVALGNGTVEAVINPVVATLFNRDKTKWLNILHAGWPGGLVLGGLLAIALGGVPWQYRVALIFLPVVGYGAILSQCRFPVNERVAAGGSYMKMLQQVGFLGAFIVVAMIVFEVARVLKDSGLIFQTTTFNTETAITLGVVFLISLAYGAYVRSLGQPMFVFLLLVMIPLATTELGTDSWITNLMKPEVGATINSGWILLYTSLIMMILRFCAGPIVHKLSPLGLLALSAAVAAGGLMSLSKATGMTILVAATLYGLGKTFFWPTMLGVVAEQFPQGGALTLNTIAGVGMLAVGVVGTPFFGLIQDNRIVDQVKQEAQIAPYVGGEKNSIFGKYSSLDGAKVESLRASADKNPDDKTKITRIDDIERGVQKNALATVAILPCIMFACYISLLVYFQSRGGYRPVALKEDARELAADIH